MKYSFILSRAKMCCSVKLASEPKAKVTMTTERNDSKHVKILQMTNKTPFIHTSAAVINYTIKNHYAHRRSLRDESLDREATCVIFRKLEIRFLKI